MGFQQRSLTSDDLDLLSVLARQEARESFWAYRQYIDPKLKLGWWTRAVSYRLQAFWNDLQAGRSPVLAIVAPPQHGKSRTLTEFISWTSGQNPDMRTIFASFGERLGERTNRTFQRTVEMERYAPLFPDLKLGGMGTGYVRNNTLLEFMDREGSFRNTTVRGAVTGEGLDLGLIDDPIKGREEASSEATRDKTWDWFTDDFFTRFSENAGLLFIMTRWHVDDPLGRMERMREDFPGLEIIRWPAIAEEDEPGFRLKGEALFPEHKSLEFILKRKAVMTQGHFEALYQGRPTIEGGTLFPIDRFQRTTWRPQHDDIATSVRYWDKAGTHGDGAYSAGVLLHKLKDGRTYIDHVYRKQVDAFTREKAIKMLAEADHAVYRRYIVAVEQEPGSGGKESAQRTVANVAPIPCRADRPVGSKELRAEPYAAQVQAGNVLVREDVWTQAFIDEHEVFPNGTYKDQVDAAAGGYSYLYRKRYKDTAGGLPPQP